MCMIKRADTGQVLAGFEYRSERRKEPHWLSTQNVTTMLALVYLNNESLNDADQQVKKWSPEITCVVGRIVFPKEST